MKPYAFGEIIVEEGGEILSPSRMKNLIGVLAKTGHVQGTKDLQPHEAGAAAYFCFACPSGNFHSAFQWWAECRRAWSMAKENSAKDHPAYAIMALLAHPEEITRLGITNLMFTDDFRLIITRERFNDHLPKALYSFETGEAVDVREMPPPKRVTWLPANVFLRIAERLELAGADVPTYEKIYCQ